MSGWDLWLRQLDSGPHSIPFYLLHTERVTVLRICYNRAFHHYGCTPRGMVTVGVPEENIEDWFGRPYQDQTILPFNLASGIDLVSRPGFTAYSISIAEDFLSSVADRCQLPVSDCLSNARSAVFIPDSRAVRNLRSTLRALFLNRRLIRNVLDCLASAHSWRSTEGEHCWFRTLPTIGVSGTWVSLRATIGRYLESCLRRHWSGPAFDDQRPPAPFPKSSRWVTRRLKLV